MASRDWMTTSPSERTRSAADQKSAKARSAARSGAESAQLADAVAAALGGKPRLTVYPAIPDRRNRARRIVVKGHADLPRVLADALDGADAVGAAQSRGIMDVEVDPVEWPY